MAMKRRRCGGRKGIKIWVKSQQRGPDRYRIPYCWVSEHPNMPSWLAASAFEIGNSGRPV